MFAPITIIEAGGLNTMCPLTLEGSFHSRTISKVCGQLVGYITTANFAMCSGAAQARTLTETLPWHVRYESFEGTLPSITGITFQIIGLSIQSAVCLYKSTAAAPARYIYHIAGGEVTNVPWVEMSPIPRFEENVNCPPVIRFQGNGIPTVPGETAKIRVRLVQ